MYNKQSRQIKTSQRGIEIHQAFERDTCFSTYRNCRPSESGFEFDFAAYLRPPKKSPA